MYCCTRKIPAIAYAMALFLAWSVAANASNDDSDDSDDPVVIGLVQALSGPGSVLSPPVTQAAELAVEELNREGGILGRPVELEMADDGTDPRVAEQAWNTLIRQQNADFVISMETSAGREAGLPIAEEENVPAIYTSLYEGESCSPILYANAEVPNQQVDPLVDYFSKNKDVESWFLVGSDYLWPRRSFEIAKRVIEESGGEVVGEGYSPIGTSNWSSIVSRIRSARPDAIMLAIAGGADNVSFMKQYRSAGLRAPVSSLDIEEGALEALGALGEDIYVPAFYFASVDTSENDVFKEKLKKRFGDDMATPTFFSTPTYDAVHQFALAAEKAGSLESEKVLKALSTVEFNGPRGKITMGRNRHATAQVYLGRGRDDGTFEIVERLGRVEATNQCDESLPFGMENSD